MKRMCTRPLPSYKLYGRRPASIFEMSTKDKLGVVRHLDGFFLTLTIADWWPDDIAKISQVTSSVTNRKAYSKATFVIMTKNSGIGSSSVGLLTVVMSSSQ